MVLNILSPFLVAHLAWHFRKEAEHLARQDALQSEVNVLKFSIEMAEEDGKVRRAI
jgi:hypothetical protein